MNSYLESNYDVIQAASNNRYVDNNNKRLVISGPIGLFNNYKLTTSPGEHFEKIEHAHIACLMYKLITTARGCDDLSIGFDRSRDRRQRELTNNRNIKGKYHVRVYLRVIFSFAKHQDKPSYGIGYKLTLTRNTDSVVLSKDNAINNAKNKNNAREWYVPHYRPSLEQQNILTNQIIKNMVTQFQYAERSVFMKEVTTKIFGLLNWGHKKD